MTTIWNSLHKHYRVFEFVFKMSWEQNDRFQSRQGKEFFSSPIVCPDRLCDPPIRYMHATDFFFRGIKRQEREVYDSAPPRGEVDRPRSFVSTPPQVFMAWCLSRGTFFFIFTFTFTNERKLTLPLCQCTTQWRKWGRWGKAPQHSYVQWLDVSNHAVRSVHRV